MSELRAVPDAIRCYGDSAAATAFEVAAAGAMNQAAVIAAAVPVFGLIGQDFLAAFAVAQTNTMLSVNEIAGVHAATAVTAHRSAAAYEAAEHHSAADLGMVGGF
ncbi:type VII secretion target [Nocardia sp. NBC_00416]|uniref:type VII secretion target n=1 Tax=Nocardia sp. NBC_00416 TaxID=2975991 RepID=UPI002E20D643